MNELNVLYNRYTANQSIIGGLLLILLWANIDSIFYIMPKGNIYAPGKYVVLLIGLGKLIDVTTGINNLILVYSKYYRYQLLFVVLLGIITVSGNYILIPKIGITGAAITALVSYFLINFTVVLFIYFKLGIQPFTKKFVLVIVILALSFLINAVLPKLNFWFFDSAYRSIILLSFFAFFTYWFRLSDDLNNLVSKYLHFDNIMKFIKGGWKG